MCLNQSYVGLIAAALHTVVHTVLLIILQKVQGGTQMQALFSSSFANKHYLQKK